MADRNRRLWLDDAVASCASAHNDQPCRRPNAARFDDDTRSTCVERCELVIEQGEQSECARALDDCVSRSIASSTPPAPDCRFLVPDAALEGRRFECAAACKDEAEKLVWLRPPEAPPVAAMPRAEDRRCDGPAACCPTEVVESLGQRISVQVGIVVMGITNINERAGTWDADFYLYERWPPTGGFTPQTEVVNESERHATQFDTTENQDGLCQRTITLGPRAARGASGTASRTHLRTGDAMGGAAHDAVHGVPFACGREIISGRDVDSGPRRA